MKYGYDLKLNYNIYFTKLLRKFYLNPATYLHLNHTVMPLNVGLSASARIQLIDSLLRHDKWWTKNQLLLEVNKYNQAVKDKVVSEATFRNDLQAIRDVAGEHLLEEARDHRKIYMRYDSSEYSIFNIEHLAPEEYNCLQQAIALLKEVKGFALASQLESIIIKLKYTPPASSDNAMVMLDGSEHYKGMDVLQQLYDAIQKKQVIHFSYKSFDQTEAKDYTLHPYLIREYNNRWYVVGLVATKNSIWTFAIDRFQSDPKPRPRVEFIPPETVGFDPLQHFEGVIGLTVITDNPVEEVKLRFTPGRAPYVLTKPLHLSQKLERQNKDGSCILKYQLRYNRELLSAILAFGEDVRVIKPDHLREKVRRQAEKMMLHHTE